ncbi:MAG: flagellar motor switch protein FliM [Clostridiales bacterium]|nr:flagellar motor switch protein FliM [Clostridiales bacterium]
MAEVLSQSQIDELLNNFSSEGTKAFEDIEESINEKKIKTYDFTMPKKFTKERLKVINDIYEVYSRLLSSFLTNNTRIHCKVKVLQIEEQRYYEFNNALPDHVIMGTVGLGIEDEDIMDISCIIQLSNSITFTLIDRLLGGDGPYIEVTRDFTEIEMGIMKGVMERMTEILKEAWASYLDINPRLLGIETNARASQSIPPDEVIVLVTLEVEIKDVTNIITISLPAVNMETVMTKFSDQYSQGLKRFDAAREEKRREGILKEITNSPLQIDVIFAETKIALADILTLQPNDIIPLNMPITGNAAVKINKNLWFDGKVGVNNKRKAIKIDNIYKN